MSKLIETLREWQENSEGNIVTVLEATIITINHLEKFKANAEPRLTKLDALEVYGVDNWEGYDEAMRSISSEDEDDE